MAGERARGEAIPVVLAPAELVDERPERERRIRAAPEDDDVGAEPERLGDRPRAEVGVRGQDRLVAERDALDDGP